MTASGGNYPQVATSVHHGSIIIRDPLSRSQSLPHPQKFFDPIQNVELWIGFFDFNKLLLAEEVERAPGKGNKVGGVRGQTDPRIKNFDSLITFNLLTQVSWEGWVFSSLFQT